MSDKMPKIEEGAGYKSLKAAVERDYQKDKTYQSGGRPFHDYQAKFDWVIERAQHYGAALSMGPAEILDAWEVARDYWYMNYYQNANQPEIGEGSLVRVFSTLEGLRKSIGDKGFRCPSCSGVSVSPYTCYTGGIGGLRGDDVCDWKSYGLLGTLGKGAFVFVKEKIAGEHIFMPVAWEVDQ